MKDKNLIVSRILLVDGILLIVIAFVYIFGTPLIRKWLTGDFTSDAISTISSIELINNIVTGMLLIPFGVSTIFAAAGVRVGQHWARAIAITNSLVIIAVPLALQIILKVNHSTSTLLVFASGMITVIGLSMLLSLLWLRNK